MKVLNSTEWFINFKASWGQDFLFFDKLIYLRDFEAKALVKILLNGILTSDAKRMLRIRRPCYKAL